jgi:WD40 repeat protein/tetratricopeptide (TPR) repeat protein
VAFSADGKALASGCQDGTVRLWGGQAATGSFILASVVQDETSQGPQTQTLRGHTGTVTALALRRDGRQLASASGDSTLRLWNMPGGQLAHLLRGHSKAVRCAAFHSEGKLLASGGDDQTVRIWDTATGMELRTLTGSTESVSGVAFSPSGRLLAAVSDRLVRIWEVESGNLLRQLEGHTADVSCVAFHPGGKRLASAGEDHHVFLWDVESGKLLHKLAGHSGTIYDISFSADGKFLASASADQTVRLWDPAAGEERSLFRGHAGDANTVCFHPAGRLLVSGGDDGTIRVWSLETNREIARLAGDTVAIQDICFDPHGKRLISAAAEDIRIQEASWDRAAPPGNAEKPRIDAVGFSGDGQRFLVQIRNALTEPPVKIRGWDLASGIEVLPCTDPALAEGQRQATSADGLFRIRVEGDAVWVTPLDSAEGSSSQRLLAQNQGRQWHLQEALQAEREKLWFTATFHLEQLLRSAPNDPELHSRCGWAYLRLEQWQQAAAAYQKACQLQPDEWLPWARLGYVRGKQSRYEEAEAAYAQALQRKPDVDWCWQERGEVLAEWQQWQRAATALGQSLKLEPDVPLLNWYKLALVQLRNGDQAGYRKTCTELVSRFGQTSDPWQAHWTAWICSVGPEALADRTVAIKLAEKAVAVDAGSSDYLGALGLALYRAGRFKEAIAYLEKANTAYGRGGLDTYWLLLALAHARLGQAEEAGRSLSKAKQKIEDELKKPTQGSTAKPNPWYHQLRTELWLAEAEALLAHSRR